MLFNDREQPRTLTLEVECTKGHRSPGPSDAYIDTAFLHARERQATCDVVATAWIAQRPKLVLRFYAFMSRLRGFSYALWFVIMGAIYGHNVFNNSPGYVVGLILLVAFTLCLYAVPWETLLENQVRTKIHEVD